FASLAVLIGAAGVALGAPWADPAVGLLITAAILTVLWQTAREVWRRLMDAVDPALVDQAEAALGATPGVLAVGDVRLRWIGHSLRAECDVVVDPASTVVHAHQIAVDAEHSLLHALPRLTGAVVHPDPEPRPGEDHHAALAGHR
ncbi:cation diffusion facilitator family transporter, partial [Actinomadura sp. NPDC048032]